MANSYLKELSNLICDATTNRVAMFANENQAKHVDQAIREAFFNIIGSEKLTWQSFRNHKNEIFTVIEDWLTLALPMAWENSRFYDQFVETKNGALGEKNSFYVEYPSYIIASRFAGGTWDTNRQKYKGGTSFSLETEWYYIRLYDDLDRFLLGTVSLADFTLKMQEALQRAIDENVYATFTAAGSYLPSAFTESGSYDRDIMNDLIERVSIASQKNVIIAGTRTALSKIVDSTDANWISESQKEEMATSGAVIENIGLPCRAIMIPQTFIRGTYDFKISNNEIFVLPDGTKPIKVYFEGDTRARDLGFVDTHDQTIDSQVQTKVGVGLVMEDMMGLYTLE